MNIAAGDLDRRITVEVAGKHQDRAGDVLRSWPPDSNASQFRRWARRKPLGRMREKVAEQEVVRDADIIWTLRADSQSRTIAPESHRIRYQERIYEIVGIEESADRSDCLDVLCATRPDKVGARGVGDAQP